MMERNRPPVKISPSILSADFSNLGRDVERLWEYGAEWVHVDCMDGHFVPNFTIGPPVVKALRKRTQAFLDCHLMMSDPKAWIGEFAKAGADGYCFHMEAVVKNPNPTEEDVQKLREVCEEIRRNKMRVGVAINPDHDTEPVHELIREGLVDMVLCMTVYPGFGGQKFMSEVMPKVARLRSLFPHLDIEVDGGVGPSTVDQVAEAGANILVAGSAVFCADDPKQVVKDLYDTTETAATSSAPALATVH